MNEPTERNLKLMATDEEWAAFMESIPRNWRERFMAMSNNRSADVDRRRGRAKSRYTLYDVRSNELKDYVHLRRRGRFDKSWEIGVRRRNDGTKMLDFESGISWGSIGQILGYLFGRVDTPRKREIYIELLRSFLETDRGNPLEEHAERIKYGDAE